MPEEPTQQPPVQAASLSPTASIAQLTIRDLSALISAEVAKAIADRIRPGQVGGAHVNSGPPGFVNGGGHANFDPPHVNSGPPGFVNGGGHANFDPDFGFTTTINRPSLGSAAGIHVNSGPPGFVNGGGHANFDPRLTSGSHVNSGPPGFVNGGGHANFDPNQIRPGSTVVLTLPDGGRINVPAAGKLNFRVRGFHIQR